MNVARIKHVAGITIGSSLCLFFGSLALADESADAHPFLSDTFNIQLGIFSPQRDIEVRVDGSIGGENGSIDFDDDLGVGSNQDIFALEFTWRFGEVWSLRTQYFDASSSNSSVLVDDIEWGDVIIEEGSRVTAGTSLTLSRLFFGRSLDSSPKYDYGIGFGVHWLNPGAFIERDIIISFGESSAVSASGPMPNIGGWFYYSPSSKWLVGGRLDWFDASVGDYAGGIFNFALGANYQLTDHLGIGAKYQIFEIDVDINKSSIWRGRMNSAFEGPYLYLSGNW
jgi:hypothetical protein